MSVYLNWRFLLRLNRNALCRTVYSGPDSTPDYTKETGNKNDTSWETKKLRKLCQRVIARAKGETFEGLDKIVDDDARKVMSLPHFTYTDDPDLYTKDLTLGQGMEVLGNSLKQAPKTFKKLSNIDTDFIRPEVQEILKRIQGSNASKVFEKRLGEHREMPKITLLTDEQLKQEYELAEKRGMNMLEMPPVMAEREPIEELIANDERLDGYEHSKLVFTDISEDLNPNERFIVVREKNGKLRKASWDERDRMLQVYFPKPNRSITKPGLFEDLKAAFHNRFHKNVLERILIQYEPDSAEYIELVAKVYDDIIKKEAYDLLRSTRFFGGLAFFLAKQKSIDNLLVYFLREQLVSEAGDLVTLFYLLRPESSSAHEVSQLSEDLRKIQVYSANEASDPKSIELAIDFYKKRSINRSSRRRTVA